MISEQLGKSLEEKLTQGRDKIIKNSAVLPMLPKLVVCPINVIKEVCSRSKFITCIDHIRDIPCLRPEFHTFFFLML